MILGGNEVIAPGCENPGSGRLKRIHSVRAYESINHCFDNFPISSTMLPSDSKHLVWVSMYIVHLEDFQVSLINISKIAFSMEEERLCS